MRKWKATLILVLCTGFLMFTACGKGTGTSTSNTAGSTESTGDTGTSGSTQMSLMDQYNELLTNGNDIEGLYTFMEENGASATNDEMESMVQSIFGYGGNFRDVDYARLQNFSDRFSDETNSFIAIMAEEQGTPSYNDTEIMVSEDKLLERARALENHIDAYPDGLTLNLAYAYYYDLLQTVITGRYNSENNIPNSYMNDDNVIGDTTINHYTDYINNNPDSNTTTILSEYLDLLEKSGGTINTDIEEFYNNLGQRIPGNNMNEQNGIGNMENQNQDQGNGTNSSNTNSSTNQGNLSIQPR